MTARRKDQPTDARFYRAAFRWMGIGLEFCIVIGFFMFIGYWLDVWEGTTPGWMILGFFVGFGFMMYTIVKRAKLTEKELDQDEGQDDETV
ncbi:MAG: AtpZ/AtpI family protein [Planctomycetales bacterium]|nr:AtpZ/AtpI family protein [Planctomycetales bacterium]